MQPSDSDVQLVAQAQGQLQGQFQQPMNPQAAPVQQPYSQPYQADPVQQPQPVQQPAPQVLPDYGSGIQGPVPGYQPPQVQQPQEQTPQYQQPQQAPVMDPFAGMGIQPPVQQPVAQPQPAPQADPVQQPQAPVAPVQQPQETQQSYEERVNNYLKQIPEPAPIPDISKYNGDNDEDVQKFFADFSQSIISQLEQKNERARAVQTMETEVWEEAFKKYPSLRTNKVMRDTVHTIRTGNHVQGKYITPTQAADTFLQGLNQQYNQGVVDSQVQQRIEQVQPMGGQTNAPVQMVSKNDELLAVQEGGEEALTQILANRFNSGQ